MDCLVFNSNVTKRWERVKEFVEGCTEKDFWEDIKCNLRGFLKDMIEIGIEEELNVHMGVQRYKHVDQRVDYRNGYYSRDLDTELGPLRDVKVARSRSGLFRTQIFERYARRQEAVNVAICNVFLSGISTRDVSGAIYPLLETTFSSSCVSRYRQEA